MSVLVAMRKVTGNVIYIGDSLGRLNSAMQVHAICIGKIFSKLGYKITYISQEGWNPSLPKEIKEKDFHCYYSETIPLPNDFIRRRYRRWNRTTGMNHWNRINEVIKRNRPDLIICYGFVCSAQLVRFSKKTGTPLLFDKTDWFTADHFKGFYSRYIYSNQMRRSITKWAACASGVIAISPFFYEFYKDVTPVIYIPALCDMEKSIEPIECNRDDDELRIVYAGSPGNKDILEPVIEAVERLFLAGNKIRFDIIGISSIGRFSERDNYSMGYVFHGRLSHAQTVDMVRSSDCSILLRRKERYAKAGFSTKLVESMWVGTPVICTTVGGADKCITDGANGFLINDNSVKTICEVLERIINMNRSELAAIKNNARIYAYEHFDYRSYVEPMRLFLNELA